MPRCSRVFLSAIILLASLERSNLPHSNLIVPFERSS
ncbi:unnamed protein product [Rhodiola kirilowii]